jgi:hypothetical protein
LVIDLQRAARARAVDEKRGGELRGAGRSELVRGVAGVDGYPEINQRDVMPLGENDLEPV